MSVMYSQLLILLLSPENEVLVNVCGKIGPNPIFDGHTYLNQVSFIILDTGKGNVRVAGVSLMC